MKSLYEESDLRFLSARRFQRSPPSSKVQGVPKNTLPFQTTITPTILVRIKQKDNQNGLIRLGRQEGGDRNVHQK